MSKYPEMESISAEKDGFWISITPIATRMEIPVMRATLTKSRLRW